MIAAHSIACPSSSSCSKPWWEPVDEFPWKGTGEGQAFGLESVCGWFSYPGFSFPCLLPWYPKHSFNQKHVQTLTHVNRPKGIKRGKATLKPVVPLFPMQWAMSNPWLRPWCPSDPAGLLVSCWGGRAASAAAVFFAFAWDRLWPVTHLFLEASFLT